MLVILSPPRIDGHILIIHFVFPPADSLLLLISRKLRGEFKSIKSSFPEWSVISINEYIIFVECNFKALSLIDPQGPPGGGGPPGTPIMPSPGGASPNYVPSTNTCLSHFPSLNKHERVPPFLTIYFVFSYLIHSLHNLVIHKEKSRL